MPGDMNVCPGNRESRDNGRNRAPPLAVFPIIGG